MNTKVLINQLSLTYSPLCNYDFTILKKDPIIQDIIERSSLYVIAQRPEMRFDNITTNAAEKTIEFEIRQHKNKNVLKCKVPLFQENIATEPNNEILAYFGSHDKNFSIKSTKTSLNNIHGIKFYESNLDTESFLLWISPEKFLHNYWENLLDAEIKGNIRDFTKYQVHYVGQATKQDIWKRLTGHDKLQDILSLEYPLIYGSLPTHEVVILLFYFKDNIQIQSFGDNSNMNEAVDCFLGRNLPEQRTIFLDAEKALINAMQPKYNDELFKNYPKSSDGLYNHNYDAVSYTLTDPITLVYNKGEIEGGLTFLGGDTISIQDNTTMELIKCKIR
ncbi:MAG: hypothetical protein PHT07_21310 [Paludibacter sp.]|nr:hypothetical protein [Paludibacter sp.]